MSEVRVNRVQFQVEKVKLEQRHILVIGATGGVGQRICREIVRLFGSSALLVGDHKSGRGKAFANALGADVRFQVVNILDHESIVKALAEVDAVIVAVPQPEAVVQSLCISRRIPCLDVTVQPDLIAKVKQLDDEAVANETVALMTAGFFPGLSGLLVKDAVNSLTRVFSIDVGLLQNANASAGVTGVADMLGMYAQSVPYRKDDETTVVPGFRVTRTLMYPVPFGQKVQRLVNFVEASLIAEKLHIHNINYWTGSDKAGLDAFIVLLNTIGLLKFFNVPEIRMKCAKILHTLMRLGIRESQPETTAISIAVSGQREGRLVTIKRSLTAPSDYGTTAMSAAAMTKLILDHRVNRYGVLFPFEVFPLQVVVETMKCNDVKIYR